MNLMVCLIDGALIFKQDKLSTMITLMGMIIGISCLGAFLQLKELANLNFEKAKELIGQDQAHVTILPKKVSQHQPLTYSVWQNFIENHDFQLIPYNQFNNDSNTIIALNPSFLKHWPVEIKSGRNLNQLDHKSRVAIIGSDHPHANSKKIFINNEYFEIVGQFSSQLIPLLEQDLNKSIIIHGALPAIIGWEDVIDTFWFKGNIKTLKGYLDLYFNHHHLFIRDSEYYLKNFVNQTKSFESLLSKISLVTLFLGSTSLLNLRLLNHHKRQREIGIRLTIGAHPKDIALLFFIETIYMGLVGGIIGILLGELITWYVVLHLNWIYIFNGYNAFITLGCALSLTFIAGLYPSIQAARLKPSFLLTSH